MKKNVIIAALTIALGICLYFIFVNHAASFNPNFRTPFPNKTAKDGIESYRDMWSGSIYKKTRVITYEASEIISYLNGPYQQLTSTIPLKSGYHWVVGFYLKRENNINGDPRNAFYVIPTMQKDSTAIYDYYENLVDYDDQSGTALPDQKTAYDAGHIWP